MAEETSDSGALTAFCEENEDEVGEEQDDVGAASKAVAKNVCSAASTITIEEAIEKMGFGPFQILITVFSGMLWVADAMELMILSVLSPTVQCQWGLSNSEAASITSIVFVGFLVGGLVWGVVADRVGRKLTLLFVNIWILVFGVLSAIKVASDDPSGKAVGYPWLLLCRFGVGFGAGGTAQAVTYYAEFLTKKARGVCLVLIEFWWAIGSMFGALLALGVMPYLGWHWYLGMATTPLFIVLFLFPFVPESARYYLMKNQKQKAKNVLKKIAWFNDKRVPEGEIVTVEEKESCLEVTVSYTEEVVSFNIPPNTNETVPLLEEDDDDQNGNEVTQKCPLSPILLIKEVKAQLLPLLDLFKHDMWKTTVLLWILWTGCAWLYYGVVLLTTSVLHEENHCITDFPNRSNESDCQVISSDTYVKIFWTSVAELPGLVVTVVIIEILGRKKTMALEFLVTMIGFLLLFICSTELVTTFFLFLTRAFATGVFQAVYVYTPEVYTTNIRASALGIHTAAARVGALLTPFNAQVLYHYSDIATVTLYGTSCLLLMISSILLPIETKGKSMKDGLH